MVATTESVMDMRQAFRIAFVVPSVDSNLMLDVEANCTPVPLEMAVSQRVLSLQHQLWRDLQNNSVLTFNSSVLYQTFGNVQALTLGENILSISESVPMFKGTRTAILHQRELATSGDVVYLRPHWYQKQYRVPTSISVETAQFELLTNSQLGDGKTIRGPHLATAQVVWEDPGVINGQVVFKTSKGKVSANPQASAQVHFEWKMRLNHQSTTALLEVQHSQLFPQTRTIHII